MTYKETLDYLFSQLPMYHRIGNSAYKANLNNTLALDEALNQPHRSFKTVHVAGTNGKGSSSHMLAAVLQQAGYKTGLYTSPHLKSFTERIKINGREIDKTFVCRFVEEYKPLFEEIKPSFFEMTVALAFDYFRDQKVDVAVIEVGLGGRLDSTNIITPEISLITNIGFDHMNLLGNTLDKIAAEKAGIMKPNVPVVISERQPETEPVFVQKARESAAPLYFATDEWKISQAAETEGCFTVANRSETAFSQLCLDLKGKYQQKNLAGVLQTLELLNRGAFPVSDSQIKAGLENAASLTGLKGRWQTVGTNPLTICDTGHNEDGIKEVLQQLQRLNPAQVHFVYGTVNDKEIAKILKLLPKRYQYYFCQPDIPRGLLVTDLQQAAKSEGLIGQGYPSVVAALRAAQQAAKPGEVVFVGGSTFVVAEVPEL